MASHALILSCEHGGNQIPPTFQHLFNGHEKVLLSHRGWDPGTLELAQYLSSILDIPLVSCTISRLLIEMNRSLDNPQLFSEYSSALNEKIKAKLIDTLYLPYRNKVEGIINNALKNSFTCLHFSIHSFTPVFNGIVRDTDIGILFDPERSLEVEVCYQMKASLNRLLPDMQVNYNSPYLGTDDGLTTFLRTKYLASTYAGVEIEINQKWVNTNSMSLIRNALESVLSDFQKRKPVID